MGGFFFFHFSNEEAGNERVEGGGGAKKNNRARMKWKGEEEGRGLTVSSNQREPAGGTERAGGVREELH